MGTARWRRRAAIAVVGAVATTLVSVIGVQVLPAGAATFTVDTAADIVDPMPGDGTCGTGSAGTCSLRAAIQEANATVGADVITLPAGTYTLSIAGAVEDAAATGDLDVTDDLTITGAGRGTTIIDANDIDRVLHVPSTWIGEARVAGPPLELRDLAVVNGAVTGGAGGWDETGGGAIAAFGPLTLDGVRVADSSAISTNPDCGDCALGGGVFSWWSLVVTGSTIEGNEVEGESGSGGGIAALGGATITDSVISGNRVRPGSGLWGTYLPLGGGLALLSALSGEGEQPLATILRTSFEGNSNEGTSGAGGGLGVFGQVTSVTDSTFEGNDATSGGAIIHADYWGVAPALTIDRTLVQANTATTYGGGIQVAGLTGGGTLVTDSTISGNTAGAGGGAFVSGYFAGLSFRRSTISGNTATGGGGGVFVAGEVSENAGFLDLDDTTVSGNTASIGGGLYLGEQSMPDLQRSTIVGNTATTGGGIYGIGFVDFDPDQGNVLGPQLLGDDCTGIDLDSGHSADSDDTCGLTEPTDLPGIDPLLGPLADNGGPTLTHRPGLTSPLIDAGAAAGATCGGLDQRGVARPQSSACDIGAVELQAASGPFVVDATTDVVDPTPGDRTCGTGDAGTCSLRAAVQEANGVVGADVITLPAGTYTLTLAGDGEDAAATGDLDVTDDLTITGAGQGTTTVDANSIDRVLHVPGDATLALTDLTVTGGAVTALDAMGGGIAATGPLALTDVEVSFNHVTATGHTTAGETTSAFSGGGGGIAANDATIVRAHLHDNVADVTPSATYDVAGGGALLLGVATIDDSVIEGNVVAPGDLLRPEADDYFGPFDLGGGGVAVLGDPADVTITGTTFTTNAAEVGGGALAWDNTGLAISASTITDNDATSGGGVAVLPISGASIDGTDISGNVATESGGGVLAGGTTSVQRSTVRSNRAVWGGAVATGYTGWPADVSITSSTISGNEATDVDGAAIGGGFAFITIADSTITANVGAGLSAPTHVYDPLLVEGTVIAGNTIDCLFGVVVSEGSSADSDGTCGLTDPTDLSGIDPMLGPLADNGGSTLTHLPGLSSPLIDAGAAAGATCGGLDQRGVARPQGAACDIGAVEQQVDIEPLTVDTTLDLIDPAPGDGTCGTGVAGTCSLRAAIQETNRIVGPDEITLPAGRYVLTIRGRAEDAGATGDLDVTDDLTITGAGQGTTTIDGDRIDRVLHAAGELVRSCTDGGCNIFDFVRGPDLTLASLTVTRGASFDNGYFWDLDWSIGEGGGIFSMGGHLSLTDVEVTANRAYVFDVGVMGGGIASWGATTITGSKIHRNISTGSPGGGLYWGPYQGTGLNISPPEANILEIVDSTFDTNVGSNGAGIEVNPPWGSAWSAHLDGVTLSRNVASGKGGGIFIEGGAGTTIVRSTLSGNRAATGGGVSGPVALRSSTVVGNEATTGGGIHVDPLFGPTTLTSTIVGAQVSGGGCAGPAAPTSLGYNLDADGTCSLSQTSDQPSTDALLGPLADNGGPTLTHLPLFASPAVDAGPVSGAPCEPTDQRGVPRPQLDACDLGAVELGPVQLYPDVPPTHPFFVDIWWVTEAGMLAGYADGTFHPAAPVTRQAFVAAMWRDAGSPAGPFPDPGFSDVPPTHPFATAIAWAADDGLVGGYADDTFRPGTSLSRQALVAILWRDAGSPIGPFPDPGFSDVPPTHLFASAIAWAKDGGLVGGYADGTFRPTAKITRQALASILHAAD